MSKYVDRNYVRHILCRQKMSQTYLTDNNPEITHARDLKFWISLC